MQSGGNLGVNPNSGNGPAYGMHFIGRVYAKWGQPRGKPKFWEWPPFPPVESTTVLLRLIMYVV